MTDLLHCESKSVYEISKLDYALRFSQLIDPSVKIIQKKDNFLMKVLEKLFFFNPNFSRTLLTIGNRVYIPDFKDSSFQDIQWLLLHEIRGHVRQFRWCGFGIHPLVGIPLFFILYGLILLPIGLAIFRFLFEFHAELQPFRWTRKHQNKLDDISRTETRFVKFGEILSGRMYLFPLPRFLIAFVFRCVVDNS